MSFLRRLSRSAATVFAWACLASPAFAAISDNNLHIDRGVTYSATTFITATGGTAPYSFSFNTALLPSGVTVSSDGKLSGVTCGSNGSFNLGTVTATDANNATQTATNIVIIVNAAPAGGCSLTVSSSSLGSASVGTPYSGTLTTSGGATPYTYSLASGSLPTGLSLSSGGTISGTPTAAGTYTFTVFVTDGSNGTGSQTVTMSVTSGVVLSLTPASLAAGTVGSAYSQTFGASGGTAPYSYSVTSGALPAGLSLSGGVLSGTPTTAGTSSFQITASDAGSGSGASSYNLVVSQPLATTLAIASRTLVAGVAATAFTPVTASGGRTAYAYAVSPSLPAGLSLNTSTGAVTGTPGAASASASYAVTVTDADGRSSSKSFTLAVGAALSTTQAIASRTLVANVAASAFTPVTAAGGSTPYAFAVSPALPTGLSLNTSTGAISGTPTGTLSSTAFTVTVTDANGTTSNRSFTLDVTAALTTTTAVASTSLVAQVAATAFTPVTASGGTAPYSFAIAPALPAGLSLNTASGQISGTPTAASPSASYTVTVTDANGSTSARSISLTVGAALSATVAVATSTLAPGAAATPFTPVTAGGGSAPYAYAIAPALPAGLTLGTGSGQVSGTTSAASAAASYTVTITDANGSTASGSFTLAVSSTFATTTAVASRTLVVGSAATPFTPVTASGGGTPYAYAIAPALPAGLSFGAASGQVSGTPTAVAAAASYTVTVTDANGSTSTKSFTLGVTAALATTANPTTTALVAGTPITAFVPVSASGGTAPYGYAITPALPAGLVFGTGNGQLSGTPTGSVASASYTVTVTDALGATSSKSFTLGVGAALVATRAVASASGTVGAAIAAFTPVTASGGTAPYAFAVTPALPAGLALEAATGRIAGTPSAAAAAASFTITVTDAAGASSAQAFTLTIVGALAATEAEPVPAVALDGRVIAFQPVAPLGGTGPFTFAISPALPTGLAFGAADGRVTGTPQASAPATDYTVTITDASGASATRRFALAVTVPSLAVAPTTLTIAQAGTTVSQTLTPSGGTAPYRFALTAGALPEGLALDADGRFSGRARRAGRFAVTVTVTDALGVSASFAITLDIGARPDPAQDARVAAVQAAQRGALQRFAQAQTGQIRARLDELDDCLPVWRQQLALQQAGGGALPLPGAGGGDCSRGLAAWVSGRVEVGRVEATSGRTGQRFSTPATSVGADAAVAPGLRIGLALGAGSDRTTLVDDAGRVDSRATGATLYGAWQLGERLRLAALAGQGWATLTSDRAITGESERATMTRSGRETHWLLQAGSRLALGPLQLAPYAGIEHLVLQLEAAQEASASANALAYEASRQRSTAPVAGVRVAWPLQAHPYRVEPTLALDWRDRREASGDQGLRYLDDPAGQRYALAAGASSSGGTGVTLGLGLRHDAGATLRVESTWTRAAGEMRQALRGSVQWPLR